MYTLYAIPNCDTVKKARSWLAERGIAYQFHDYKKQGIDRATLDRWLGQHDWESLVNRSGTTWRRLPETEKPTNAEQALQLMLGQPSAIRRPIIELEGRLILMGFNANDYATVFGTGPTV